MRFNGALYFAATDRVNGSELWKSDGLGTGTLLLKDISPGVAGSAPSGFTEVGGALYFAANDGSNGSELWKTSGTDVGTVLVKDINPARLPIGSSVPQGMVALNGALYFSADDGVNGRELWKSDGTTAGTVMLKDINPNSGASNPSDLSVFNGAIYFRATDGQHGAELWKSDGTAQGTVLLKDIDTSVVPVVASSNPTAFRIVAGSLLFQATTIANGTELWKTDGTEAGTVLFKDICPLTCSGTGN